MGLIKLLPKDIEFINFYLNSIIITCFSIIMVLDYFKEENSMFNNVANEVIIKVTSQ
jgi:hypothetical protein